MNTFAEIFPPGEFLREELEARNWSQTELAEIMGRPVRLINEIIAGKKAITPETAIQLGESLGTGAEVWMNLESQYQLSKVRMADNLIARRADLYNRFPVREMTKRGWITASKSIEVLEQQFLEFFDITRFDFHDIVLTRGYVDLGLLLAQVADEFYPILNEQRKEAQVDICEDLTVLVDGDKMARVFNNIMKNAVAYSYEGSTITIEARRTDDGGVRVRFIN